MTLERRARKLVCDLVTVDSPSGREGPVGDVLLDHLDALGLEAHRDEVGNVHGRRPEADPESPTVVLLGHIDTVPGRLPVELEDGTVYGRGAVDAKGPLVAHALALRELSDDVDLDLRLVGAVGEETDSRGAGHLCETLDPDGLVIAEPTGLSTVGLGYKGRVEVQLAARAVRSHPGEPSPTAGERLIDAIEQLTRRTDNPDRDVGVDETTLRVIDLSTDRDAETERARARLDLRFPGQPPDVDVVEACLQEGVSVDTRHAVAGVRADPKNPLATALRGTLRARGLDPRAAVKTGTSDWNLVHEAWGCPGVAYGPGDPELDHSPDERIEVAAVAQAAQVLAGALERASGRLGELPAQR